MSALLAAGAGGREDPVVGILIALVLVLLGAKLAGELVERLGVLECKEATDFLLEILNR